MIMWPAQLLQFFNTIPNVSYSGNIGLMGVTGVKCRYVVGVAGIMITVLGFIPKLATFYH